MALACCAAAPAGAQVPPAPTPNFSFSSMICTDANGGVLRIGDVIACQLNVTAANANAYGVTVTIPVPTNATFDPNDPLNNQVTVDNVLNPKLLTFDQQKMGDFTGGGGLFTKTGFFRLRLAPNAVSGQTVAVVATIHGYADQAQTQKLADLQVPAASPLVVALLPPDLTPSTFICTDVNGGTLRPGDQLACELQIRAVTGREDAGFLGTQVTIPDATTWLAGGNESTHNATTITWTAPTIPGGIPSAGPPPPPERFNLVVRPETPGGTVIAPVASVVYQSPSSELPSVLTLTATALTTAPGTAVLTASSLACGDVNGPPVLPDDEILCTLTATAAAGRENVTALTGQASIPGATQYVAGGSSVTSAINFDQGQLGSLPAGTSKVVTYRIKVAPGTPAGTAFQPTAALAGTSTPSNTPVSHQLAGPTFVVAAPPGAAPPKAATPVTGTAAPKVCASRRKITMHFRPPRGQRWKSISVTLLGKAAKVNKGKSVWSSTISLAGQPRKRVAVSIVGRTTSGRKVPSTRRYWTCTPKGKA